MPEPSYTVDGVDLEPAIEAAERIISTSPRKAVYEMAWDLAEAAVRASFPLLKKQLEGEHKPDA
jgi:hypothetical protein